MNGSVKFFLRGTIILPSYQKYAHHFIFYFREEEGKKKRIVVIIFLFLSHHGRHDRFVRVDRTFVAGWACEDEHEDRGDGPQRGRHDRESDAYLDLLHDFVVRSVTVPVTEFGFVRFEIRWYEDREQDER